MDGLTAILTEVASPLSWKLMLSRMGSALALSAIIAWFFILFFKGRTGKKTFAFNLILTGMLATFLAGIIASSVALSLGMVGAISIIRFRTKLSDPASTMLIFLVMAAGLGIGLDKGFYAWIATICILIIWAAHLFLSSRHPVSGILEIKTTQGRQIIAHLKNFRGDLRLTGYYSDTSGERLRIEIDEGEKEWPEALADIGEKFPGTTFIFSGENDEE